MAILEKDGAEDLFLLLTTALIPSLVERGAERTRWGVLVLSSDFFEGSPESPNDVGGLLGRVKSRFVDLVIGNIEVLSFFRC